MERKDLSNAPLEDILYECAMLRGVDNVSHRSLHEFDWFVQECIFGSLKGKYEGKKKELPEWGKRPLRNWALLFYEYCLEEYT